MNRTEADFDGFIQLLHCCGIEKSEPLYELAAIDRPDLPQLDRSFDGEPVRFSGGHNDIAGKWNG